MSESPTKSSNTTIHDESSTLLILGSCALDRLLTVPRYPAPETKVRTTSFHEVGGGNAANAAHAAALLFSSTGTAAERQRRRRVRLCTKVGDDAVGDAVVRELQGVGDGMDVRHDLFRVVRDTTTALTTVIVSASPEHARTCIHTPGTCGEWSVDEMRRRQHVVWDRGERVCHVHSDARHTEAACYLARGARQRGIPVSLDVEKDRGSTALDELLELADLIFTNEQQLEAYLQRLTHEWEIATQRRPLETPILDNQSTTVSPRLAQTFVHALEPMTYFTRRYGQVGKEVIITKGKQGSIHVQCESIHVAEESPMGSEGHSQQHTVTLEEDPSCAESEGTVYRLRQVFVDHTSSSGRRVQAVYTLRAVGVLPGVTIVDTTGAGDAFLGGYLAAQLDPDGRYPTVTDRMRLASWVAGHKLQGPGARSTLPTAAQREAELGEYNHSASLRSLITSFGCSEGDTSKRGDDTDKEAR